MLLAERFDQGLGTPQVGDGVYGLRRAVTLAGAHSQVMTLWQVNGPETFDILEDFASHVAGGEDRLSAMRAAQQRIRHRAPDGNRVYSHPYYWAGLYFMGDPRAMAQK